jgi:hypothetical protein
MIFQTKAEYLARVNQAQSVANQKLLLSTNVRLRRPIGEISDQSKWNVLLKISMYNLNPLQYTLIYFFKMY